MEANARLFNLINEKEYPEQVFYTKQKESTIRDNILNNISTGIREREFNQLKLQNELYQLHLQQQQRELWMLGIVTALLSIGFCLGLHGTHKLFHRIFLLSEREKEATAAGKPVTVQRSRSKWTTGERNPAKE